PVKIRRNVDTDEMSLHTPTSESVPAVHRTTQMIVPPAVASIIPPDSRGPSHISLVTFLFTGIFISPSRNCIHEKEYQQMKPGIPILTTTIAICLEPEDMKIWKSRLSSRMESFW